MGMPAIETMAYLDTINITEALWWFIENVGDDDTAYRNQIFFYLRERYRDEYQSEL